MAMRAIFSHNSPPFSPPALFITLFLITAVVLLSMTPGQISAQIAVNASHPGAEVAPYLNGSVVHWATRGQGVLENNPSVTTIHPTAISRARQMNVSILRFGEASMEQYNWRDGVGPNRPRRIVLAGYHFSTNEFGITEAYNYARTIGAELMPVVPIRDTRDVRDTEAPFAVQLAANYVEFCNGTSPGLDYGQQRGWQPTIWVGTDVRAGDSQQDGKQEQKVAGSYLSNEKAPDGYFAWLREYFGHPAPFNIKFWEIGNETYLFHRQGKPWARPEVYAEQFTKFVDAMKEKDPSILIGAQGWMHGIESTDPARYSEGYRWSNAVFGSGPNYSQAYQKADFIIVHEYVGPQTPSPSNPQFEYNALFGGVELAERRLGIFQEWYPKPVFVTEYHVQYGVFGSADPVHRPHQHRLKSALAISRMQHAFVRQGVSAANLYHLLDLASGPGGWQSSSTFRLVYDQMDGETRRQGVTAPFLALTLYGSRTVGRTSLPVNMQGHDTLDAVALRKPGSTLSLLVINMSASQSVSTPVNISGFKPASQAQVYTLNSPDGMEGCMFLDQNKVQITNTQLAVSGSSFNYTFPAHSLTVIDLEPEGAGSSTPEPPPTGPGPGNPDPGDPGEPDPGNPDPGDPGDPDPGDPGDPDPGDPGNPGNPDPEPGDNPVFNPNPANIELQISTNNPSPQAGQIVTFTTVCRNLGIMTVPKTDVSFQIPDGMDYIAGSATPAAVYSAFTRRLTWVVSSLKPGQSRQLRANVRVR